MRQTFVKLILSGVLLNFVAPAAMRADVASDPNLPSLSAPSVSSQSDGVFDEGQNDQPPVLQQTQTAAPEPTPVPSSLIGGLILLGSLGVARFRRRVRSE